MARVGGLSAATALVVVGDVAMAVACIAAAAAIVCAGQCLVVRANRTVWLALTVFTGSMAGNTYVLFGLPADWSLGWLAVIFHGGALVGVATASWLGVRPLLAHHETRVPTLVALPAGLGATLGVLIADAAYQWGETALAWLGVAGAGASILVAWGAFAMLGRRLWVLGRRADVVIGLGLLAHVVSQTISLAAQRNEGIWLAITLSSGSIIVASRLQSASAIATPPGATHRTFAVRLWPLGMALAAIISIWLILRAEPSIGSTAAIAGLGASIAMILFAARELAGPRKPLVMPFSKRDRALQHLPAQLMRGSVRLVGRPVHRAHDGAVVGIEAEPTWSDRTKPNLLLPSVASEAQQGPWLHDVTYDAARSHLIAVVANLDGDDPFLSIPFDPTHVAEVPNDDLDGLLLRTPSAIDPSLAATWQDRGAMIQSPLEALENGTVTDVVFVDENTSAPPVAMGLAHLDPGAKRRGLMFVVDPTTEPSPLGQILSPFDADRPGERVFPPIPIRPTRR